MGIGLALFQVDHDNTVVRGSPVLNRALRVADPTPLRELLKTLPFDESESVLEHLRHKLARLREVGAPAFFIEGMERRLLSATRPEPGALDQASLADLRLLLGGWCREARTTDLDKAWDLIHWFADSGRRQRLDGDWREQPEPFSPSAMDYAVYGREAYPADANGGPVILTGGSPDLSRYNPPDTVVVIARALAAISTEGWAGIDPEIDVLSEEQRPYLADINERLDYARGAFGRMRDWYERAARRGFGVSVEFY